MATVNEGVILGQIYQLLVSANMQFNLSVRSRKTRQYPEISIDTDIHGMVIFIKEGMMQLYEIFHRDPYRDLPPKENIQDVQMLKDVLVEYEVLPSDIGRNSP